MQADKQVERSELSEQHAKLLEWFFGVGRATFGRSTCGAIIDRLQMFAFGSEPCGECNGTGFRGGWSYGDAPGKSRARELADLLGVNGKKRKHRDPDARCERCKGSGVMARTSVRHAREQLTARPRSTKSEGGGYTPTDYALQHYAIACRRIDEVNRFDPRAVVILEAFHGDWGGRWAGTDKGRLFALYPLTAAGQKLLKMSRKKAQLENYELRPDEVLAVEFSLQASQPDKLRGELLKSAMEQSKRALAQASRSWNACEPGIERDRRIRREEKRREKRNERILELVEAIAESGDAEAHDAVIELLERHRHALAGKPKNDVTPEPQSVPDNPHGIVNATEEIELLAPTFGLDHAAQVPAVAVAP